jgi:tetratricopeptide (TPR) repeat protein
MMRHATQKSGSGRPDRLVRRIAALVLCLGALPPSQGAEPPAPDVAARETYATVGAQFANAPDAPEIAWKFGRACFDWAEFATNHTQRAAIAQEGIAACKRAIQLNPDLAAAHYYLGMNQGQLARTKGLGALKLVQEMEAHFRKARELDPTFDRGGPDRNLGLLYLEAPGWPVSLGNRNKARAHLSNAIAVAPGFPENRLNLMDAHARWDEMTTLRRELAAFDEYVIAARKEFSGSRWYWDWRQWDARLERLRRQADGE